MEIHRARFLTKRHSGQSGVFTPVQPFRNTVKQLAPVIGELGQFSSDAARGTEAVFWNVRVCHLVSIFFRLVNRDDGGAVKKKHLFSKKFRHELGARSNDTNFTD